MYSSHADSIHINSSRLPLSFCAYLPINRSDFPIVPCVASRLSQYATQLKRSPLPGILVTPCTSRLSAITTELSGASIAILYRGNVRYARHNPLV